MRSTSKLLLMVAAVLTLGAKVTAEEPLHRLVDERIAEGWKKRGIAAAPLSDDAEFVRRVHLDLTGMIPDAESVRRFLADKSADRRNRLIDGLAESPEFSLHLARVVDTMLIERRVNVVTSYDIPVKDWRDFLAQAIAEDRPWDRLVSDVLGSDGSDDKTRAAVKFYLARNVQPHELTRDIGRLFLGRDLACAQCHDDPRIKDYTQEDYYGIYAFVSRMSFYRDMKKNQSLVSEKAEGKVDFTSVFTGMKGMTNPRLLRGEMIADPSIAKDQAYLVAPDKGSLGVPRYSRRKLLARELPRRETVGFSRNIANRLWALMMGRGLVHPLDLDHSLNPPSHPELLDLLASRFEDMNYDVRAFLRELARTRTYQLASRRPAGQPEPLAEAFAVASLRPLSPEQFAWSVLQATGRVEVQRSRPTKKSAPSGSFAAKREFYAGLDREATALANRFMGPPGNPEGQFEPTVNQALFLLNGTVLLDQLQPTRGHLVDRLTKARTAEEVADALYVAVLSRPPAEEEIAEVRQHLTGSSDRLTALRELASALLLGAEFRLNH